MASPGAALAADIVNRVAELLIQVQQANSALEIDPWRERLFELFVMADATGYLAEGAEHDLSSEAIGRKLALDWDLASAIAGTGLQSAHQLPPDQFHKVRLLWSFMRMWMEWDYAWGRWPEFHRAAQSLDDGTVLEDD